MPYLIDKVENKAKSRFIISMGRRVRDRMIVGFTTTCAIGPYHH